MQPVRILIIRFSSIGDIVLTTPVIRNLKMQFDQEVEVHFITKKQYLGILEPNPYLSRVWTIEKSTNEIIKELKEVNFDYVIDLHNNIRSGFLKRKLGIIDFTFNKINFRKWLLVNLGINKMPNVHVVDRYMETLKYFGIKNDNKGLDFFIPPHQEVDISSLPPQFRQGYIAFAIGAQHWRKKLPLKHIITVCKNLNYPVILLGGPEDAETGSVVAKECGEKVFSGAGKYSLAQSASLVKQSQLVISHDTGLMHIAAALKKRIISVWGATVPEFGMYPYFPGENSEIIQAEHLKKRPCSKLGTKCKYKPCRCVEEIDPDLIVVAAGKTVPLTR